MPDALRRAGTASLQSSALRKHPLHPSSRPAGSATSLCHGGCGYAAPACLHVAALQEKRSAYAPTLDQPVRYDGIYRITHCWRRAGAQGMLMCRYLFRRCDNEPAPWSVEGEHCCRAQRYTCTCRRPHGCPCSGVHS